MLVGEGMTRTRLQILLKSGCLLLIFETDESHKLPRFELAGMRGSTLIMLGQTIIHVGS